MEKKELNTRIKHLNLKVQNYIESGIELGFINENNFESIIKKLEKVEIQKVYGQSFAGYTEFNKDKIIIQICDDQIKKEALEFHRNLDEYEDETYFHELTHAICELSINDNNDLLKKIMDESHVDNKFPLDTYYHGFDILNEYIAQSISQKMVSQKYHIIYPMQHKNFYFTENGKLSDFEGYNWSYDSQLFWYGEIEQFAIDFLKSVYGNNYENAYQDYFNGNLFIKIYQTFLESNNGNEDLYKCLGYMGNIIVSDYYEQGYFGKSITEEFSNLNLLIASINGLNEITKKTKKL